MPSFSPIGGSTAGAASSRITRALVESMCRNAPLSVWSASSAICPAISTPVGPAPTTTNVSSFSRRSGSLDRSACSNAPRMRPRSSSASSIDLHARRELGELVVAEVGLPGAGGDDQAVVRGPVGVAEQHRVDRLVRQVDVGDLAEQHLGVLLLAQDQPGRRGDLALGDDARRHLVQQRLEQVVGGLGDQLDVDIGLLQLLGGVQPAETRIR